MVKSNINKILSSIEIPYELRNEYPFQQNSISLNGNGARKIRLNYIDEGSGPIVVMVHGNPTWSFYFRNLVKILSRNYRVIVPDHIGCGLSEKPQDFEYTLQNHIENLSALLNQLHIKKYSMIVHDWGGPIGIGHVVKCPDDLQSLTILNTAAFTSKRIPNRINILKNNHLGKFIIRRLNGFSYPATSLAVTKKMPDLIKKGYLLPYNNYNNRIANFQFVMDIPLSPNHRSFKTLKKIELNLNLIKCPKLIAWGERDFCFDKSFLEKWIEIYPEAKIEKFKNAGHYILEDAKGEIEKTIEGFLNGVLWTQT